MMRNAMPLNPIGHSIPRQRVRKAIQPRSASRRWSSHGRAHGIRHSTDGAQDQPGTLSFQVTPDEPAITCLLLFRSRCELNKSQRSVADGDEVEVSGVWDGRTLDADEIRVFSSAAPAKRQPSAVRAKEPPATSTTHRRGRTVALAALAGVIVIAAAAVVWFTDGFGLWTRPGPIVKPVSVAVFSPGGSPDNPQKAGAVIDGDPDTSWPTVTYRDPVPFPNFVEGEGLVLHLAEPTALSVVTIDLSSTGTEVQIRSSPTETPSKLADTTELTPTTQLQPGHNRIDVRDQTKTSNVVVWISTLGTTDGQSRTAISEITLQAAAGR